METSPMYQKSYQYSEFKNRMVNQNILEAIFFSASLDI